MEIKSSNSKNIERAIVSILKQIGENPSREGLVETPKRISRMYKEIFRGYNESQKPKITTFNNDNESEEMVFDSGDYYSMCEHHMMPFFGKYCLAYIPNAKGKILGISKIGRVVDYCSARLQLQENLARDIVTMLKDEVDNSDYPSKGFAIMMKGRHLCKSMRGARKEGEMTVLYCTGIFKEDKDTLRQFIDISNKMIM